MPATIADPGLADEATRADRLGRVRRLARLARLLDTAVRVPGTSIRFGLDSVLGLVPGIGDAAGGMMGLYIVNEARRLGLPNRKLVRMLANLGADFAIGSVPLAGDVFDVFFKAHRRNIDMVLDHFGDIDAPDLADLAPERIIDVTPTRRSVTLGTYKP